MLTTASMLAVLALAGCDNAPRETEQATDTSNQKIITLGEAQNHPARSTSNKLRDEFRNPVETLQFFGIEPDMTVVEIWPGSGWYTEILAPYLQAQGQLYAAHFPASDTRSYYAKSRQDFAERLSNDPYFSDVILTEFAPLADSDIAPPASADMVLTFRNLHNWYMAHGEEGVEGAFSDFYEALKPGGVLGVVDHRLPEDRPDEDMASTGYMKESWVIEQAEQAGFVLDASSDVNANPDDTADHPRGVWTLPPTLRLGEDNRDYYVGIGESDRFTLRFVKPETTNE
ncbi:methyltransferase [Pseudidiomarina salinarum]|nr:methyltransferase [Pseudidiomarina salinarum]